MGLLTFTDAETGNGEESTATPAEGYMRDKRFSLVGGEYGDFEGLTAARGRE